MPHLPRRAVPTRPAVDCVRVRGVALNRSCFRCSRGVLPARQWGGVPSNLRRHVSSGCVAFIDFFVVTFSLTSLPTRFCTRTPRKLPNSFAEKGDSAGCAPWTNLDDVADAGKPCSVAEEKKNAAASAATAQPRPTRVSSPVPLRHCSFQESQRSNHQTAHPAERDAAASPAVTERRW